MNGLHRKRADSGFAILSAIVLVVVLAALGAAIVTISTTQQVGSAMDVQGFRAYQAARSGIEWGVYQVWSSSPTSRPVVCPVVNQTPYSFTPTAPTLNAFTVTVTCFSTTDPNNGPTIFTIISVACNMPTAGKCVPGGSNGIGGLNYVERSVTVSM